MAQHKTIDRRKAGQKKSASVPAKRNQTTAASVQAGREHRVIDRRQTGQKQTVAVPAAGAKNQTAQTGGYYSPREYGAQTGAYEARVTAARTAMEEQGKSLQTSRTEVENLWKAAQDAQTAYQNCRGMFKGATAAQYEQQFLTRWTEAAQSYSQRYQQFEQEYEKYKPYEDAYNAALGEYNAYVSAERAEYDRWRGSIRDSESIRKERSELQGKRAELQRLMQEQNAIASGTAAPGIQAQAAQNEARIKELQEYLGGVGEREKLLAEELDWSEHFRFEDLRQNGDFGEKSRFTGVDNQGDRVYQYVNGNPNAGAGTLDGLLDDLQDGKYKPAPWTLEGMINRDLNNEAVRDILNINKTPARLGYMTEDEKAMYNYVYHTQGNEAANAYLEYLDPELNERETAARTGKAREFAGKNALTAALASAGSVLLSPASGLYGTAGQVASTIRGEELDPNASYNLMANTKNAIRDEVSGKIQEHAGPVGSFAYGTVMSMADMAMDAATGNPAAATALIGTRAFSEQVIDSKNRGLSDEQALYMGFASAFAELVTEKLGLDAKLHLPEEWATAGFWKGAARGAGGEALEEGLTNLMNLAADISIAGDKSEFAQSVERYKAEGLSEGKALWEALGDAGWSLAADMAGGAISGGVYGGWRGYQGKKATEAQEKAEKAVKLAEEEMPPQSQSDSSPMRGTGEPLGDGTEAVPYREESDGQQTPQSQSGGSPMRSTGEPGRGGRQQEAQAGKTLDELRQIALNHRNPLLTGSLNNAQQEEELRRIRNAQTRTEVTGIDYGATDEQVQEALRIGKLIGKEVLFAPKGQSYNAFYDRASDEIHVAPDAENLLAAAVGHELTHSIERTGEWERLRGLVATRMAQTGVSMESARRDRMEKHTAAGLALTDERTVDQEIVANFVEKHLLTDEQSIRALVRDERSIARRILDWLDGLWAKIAKTEKSKEREFVRQAREIYRSALAEDAGKRRRQDLRRAAQDAYADGDDAAGDAALDAALGENPEGWLETDWEDYDENEIEYSIREDAVDVNGTTYDRVVELDYKTFNRVKRSSKAYIDFIRNNLIKQKITVFDDNGDSEVIEFAGEKERVWKDGAKNKHPVIGELTQAKNETKKLVIANAVETAEISRLAGTSDEHSHQWLDENGWEERTSYVMTNDGTIYPVTLHIAKTRDGRNILYDINVKIKEGVAAEKIATSQGTGQAFRTTKPSAGNIAQKRAGVKKYSVREQEDEGSFTKGWHDDDEAARAAQMEGYPVINGVQVVPMKTFVLAQDFRKDKAGNVIQDKQGNPIQNHNYGLVAGLGSKPGTLKINFHNKHKVNEETGETLRRDGVEIDIADLTPTPGVFQQIDEDFQSLIEQAPEEETYYSEEDWTEIEALRNRASMEEAGGGRPENWASVTREDITGRARESLQRGERQLAGRIAGLMMVPRWARQDFLEPVVRGLIDTYLEQGTVDQGLRDELFDTAWKEGRVVEREFYDTFKDVKDYLRTTPMHVPQEIRDSIRNFDEYSKRVFGKLRTKKDGGVDIDTVWDEAQRMAPALFPDDILNREERVEHMLEVAGSIARAEKNLDEFYAEDLEDAKQWSRNNFEAAVQDAIRTAWEVRRVALDQQADAAAVAGEDGEVLTVEEVTKLYPKLKDTRRAVEKAMAKHILSKQDKNQVQRLLRHDIQPEHLDPEVDNVRGIMAVYEAKKAFEEIAKPIREWNRQRKARLYAEAEELVYEAEMAGGIQDKSKGFLYSRETMERNFRDIVKDRASADKLADTYIKPVHQGEAAATRMKNEYRDRVRALDISRKVRQGDQVSEAYAVQFYGEVSDILRMMEQSKFRLKQRDGKSYKEWKAELQKLWEENPSLDKGKIENAAREMGKIYEELFTQMNQARVENGYEPINHRSGYFPHFQQDGRDGILSQFGKALGIDVEVQALPTSINGMTHTFKSGIRWIGNALERKTFDTAYDAVEGFDRYIEGCASVVHQTANIQRLRALANQIRYRTGDEGLREQIRKIQAREDLTDEQKDTLIRETASEGKFQLSNFVVELDEYTNLLANKKSRADRNMEQAMGRDMYNIVKGLESRVAANMVAINPGSWLTNFIPITQGWAALDSRNLLKGMMQTIRAVKTDDGMVDMSDFLTNRVGSDALVQTTAQKVSGVLSSPMEWIDGFTAGSLVRARYAQNVAQGMSEAEAMSEADEWTAGVMADRSKGAMPTVFHRSNPLTKVFTQFQLEVNNQLGYMFKDIPREKRKKGVLAVAAALLKLALGAWLYNELYEKLLGRRPALDPIDMAFGFVKDWADPELDFADAAANLGGKIAENTPFIGGLVGGGRVPISSALPDVGNLVKAVGDSDWSAGKKLAAAGKELAKPLTYMVLPFGGGQVKKIWEGLKMIRKDGSYTVDKDGRPLLQYPLYSTNDAVQKALEAGQAMLFGKTTIRSGRAWVEGGFKTLSADQTATYQALVNLGVEQADAFELMQELRGAEKTDKQSRAQVQRDILRSSGLEGDALGIVYYDLLVDDGSKEKALMEGLQKDGADMGAVTSCLMDMKDAKESSAKREILLNAGLDGETLAAVYKDLMVDDDSKEKALLESLQKGGADMGRAASCLMRMKDAADSNAKRDILRTSGLTDEQKQDIYRDRISESYDERIGKFRETGMDMDDFLTAQNEYARIKDSYEDEGDMATAFARWVNNSGYTAAQKAVIRDSLKYWKQMPANADGYDRAIEAGLSDADAAELVEDLKAVTPLEGEDNVKQYQNWRVAIDNAVNEKNQLTLLKSVGMNDASYAKCEALWNAGVAPAAYVRAKELESQFNEDGKGSLKNTEWTQLIDSMTTTGIVLAGDNTRFHLTNEQKGFLWQMLTGSKSTKNNPYSVRGGEKWLEIKEEMEEEKEE